MVYIIYFLMLIVSSKYKLTVKEGFYMFVITKQIAGESQISS